MLPKESGHLLAHAESILYPEIFSHPVWVRFVHKNKSFSQETINNLFTEADKLLPDKPSEACQVLLVCSVFQHYGGQSAKALTTIQKAQNLAEKTRLNQEIIWSLWGASAICFQQENLEQSAGHLAKLKDRLNNQNDWIMIDFIDIVRQALLHPGATGTVNQSMLPRDQPTESLLSHALELLNQWGFFAGTFEPNSNTESFAQSSQIYSQATPLKSLLSLQRLQVNWHSLMLMVKGELKLSWGENNTNDKKGQSSFRRLIASFLHFGLLHRKTDIQMLDAETPINIISTAPDEPIVVTTPAYEVEPASTPKPKKIDHTTSQTPAVIPISVQMLGHFNVTIQETNLKLPSSRGLSVLKYLLLHHKQNTPREVLMDIFWPEAEPETARNNLNVAIHSLRRALRSVFFLPVIVFEDGAYSIDANLQVWLDVEEFERCVKSGQRLEDRNQLTAAVAEYEAATSLYQGDFLEQNPYEEWTVLDRERLRITYLDMLDHLCQIYFSQEHYAACITICQLILMRDRCREDAHSLLMRCYSRQGQYPLALRQYQNCVKALRTELEVDPAPETTKVYNRIRRHELV